MTLERAKYSPGSASGSDGDLRRSGTGTSGVGNVESDGGTRGNIDGPGQRGGRSLVKGLENASDITTGSDGWEVRSCTTRPRDGCWLTFDQDGGRVDGEGGLSHGQAGGGEGRQGEDNGRVLHLSFGVGWYQSTTKEREKGVWLKV